MKSQVNFTSNHSVGVDNFKYNMDVNVLFVKTSCKVNLETSIFQNSSFFQVLS